MPEIRKIVDQNQERLSGETVPCAASHIQCVLARYIVWQASMRAQEKDRRL